MRASSFRWTIFDPDFRSELAAKELSLTKPNRHFDARADGARARRPLRSFLVVLVLMLTTAALIPAAASAQDPSCDQYCPYDPGGGNHGGATSDGGSTPSPTFGSGDGNGTPGSGTGDDGATVPPSAGNSTPEEPGSTGAEGSGNKRERTLDGIVATAQEERAARDGDRDAVQLSSSSDGSSGIGWYVWVALALILVWAVATGVARYRGRAAMANDAKVRAAKQQTA